MRYEVRGMQRMLMAGSLVRDADFYIGALRSLESVLSRIIWLCPGLRLRPDRAGLRADTTLSSHDFLYGRGRRV